MGCCLKFKLKGGNEHQLSGSDRRQSNGHWQRRCLVQRAQEEVRGGGVELVYNKSAMVGRNIYSQYCPILTKYQSLRLPQSWTCQKCLVGSLLLCLSNSPSDHWYLSNWNATSPVSIGSVDCGSGWYLVVLGQYRAVLVYTWCYLVFVESFVCFCWELCHFSFIFVWDSFIVESFVVFCWYRFLLKDLFGFVERLRIDIKCTIYK